MSKTIAVAWHLRLALLFMPLLVLVSCGGPFIPEPELSVELQASVPDQFEDTRLVSVSNPTALAFTPDGRLLITTQPGELWIYQKGTLSSSPALDISAKVCAAGTQGLLGATVDPNFTSNGYIYLYYTFDKDGTGLCARNINSQVVNRVSRFTMTGSSVSQSSERVLIDNIPSPFGGHNAGDLQFGKDGLLYISTGDGGCDYKGDSGCARENDASRDTNVLLGKILRITKGGAVPSGNPFQGSNSARCNTTGRTSSGRYCQETYASGLRNPFRFAFDPNASGTRFFINDVGQGAWEEIDLGKAGADYGWNVREGSCKTGSTSDCGTVAGFTNPIFSYRHGLTTGTFSGCGSVTGGAFVPNGLWPGFDGAYLFSDYVCGKIFKLTRTSSGYSASVFASGLGASSAVHMVFGPHNGSRALYYTSYADGGEVRRVTYTGSSNQAPSAVISAEPTSGSVPLEVSFSASGSRDPEGAGLIYQWSFGDGATGGGATAIHTYQTRGDYTATLTVRDPLGAQGTATVRISAGNTPPAPAITAPTSAARFRVDDVITLRGQATDAEDGVIDGSRLSWRVILHHGNHTHPHLSSTPGQQVSVTMPPPEDLAATTNSYLEVFLTATDSGGLSRTISQKLLPRLVNVTFNTEPGGLKLRVNGETITAPRTLSSWERYALNVGAPSQTTSTGKTATFRSWSDGGAASHTITTPAAATSYTATFSLSGGQAVTSFTLINAATDQPISGYNPLRDGTTLDIAKLPTRRLNVRANTSPSKVGSVRFTLNGKTYRTESGAPYALAGNSGSDYYAWIPSLGSYTLTARPYSGSGATGTAGTAKTIRFKVVDSGG